MMPSVVAGLGFGASRVAMIIKIYSQTTLQPSSDKDGTSAVL